MKGKRAIYAVLPVALSSWLAASSAQAQERQSGDPIQVGEFQAGGVPNELVQDGGFEAGTPNPSWTESSTNFDTPICDLSCGQGDPAVPFAGSWWAWFGGIDAFEQSSVSQTIQGGADDTCNLSFWLKIPFVSGNGTDFLEARIGGVTVWSRIESEGLLTAYTQITENVSAWIDGTPQMLEFFSEISGTPDLSNFFIDEVSLTCGGPTDLIFADGFESGDTSAWSNTTP